MLTLLIFLALLINKCAEHCPKTLGRLKVSGFLMFSRSLKPMHSIPKTQHFPTISACHLAPNSISPWPWLYVTTFYLNRCSSSDPLFNNTELSFCISQPAPFSLPPEGESHSEVCRKETSLKGRGKIWGCLGPGTPLSTKTSDKIENRPLELGLKTPYFESCLECFLLKAA